MNGQNVKHSFKHGRLKINVMENLPPSDKAIERANVKVNEIADRIAKEREEYA